IVMTMISIVEDDETFCHLMIRNLSRSRSIRISSIHPNAEEALEEIPQRRPDVVLMDIKLPRMDGIECVRRLKAISPELPSRVLMLTEYEDSELVFGALKAGADGYLLKDRNSTKEILGAIKDVLSGGAPMSPGIARKVIRYFQAPSSPALGALSKR